MNSLKNIMFVVGLVLAFGVIVEAESTANMRATSTVPVESVDASVNSGRRTEVREKVKEVRRIASSTQDRACTNLEARISKRLDNFDALYDRHVKVYNLHKGKLLEIKTKLNTGGISTVKLEADLILLDEKIVKLASNKDLVRTALENTRNSSCGDSSGEFRSAIQTARDAQKAVATDAKDIHDFISTTLKQDIIDLRASFKLSSTSTLPI